MGNNLFSFNKISTRSYSTSNKPSVRSVIDPWFITGLTDGDGSFYFTIVKTKAGFRINAIYSIPAFNCTSNLAMLLEILQYFDAGNIVTNSTGRVVTLRITDLAGLLKVIKHFNQYPIQSRKIKDFILFQAVVKLIETGEHLTSEGVQKILMYKSLSPKGLNDGLKLHYEFKDTSAIYTQSIVDSLSETGIGPDVPLAEGWIAGFTEAEGNFNVNLVKDKSGDWYKKATTSFRITQHIADISLMERIVKTLGVGVIHQAKPYEVEGRNVNKPQSGIVCIYIVSSMAACRQFIVPLFERAPLHGEKGGNYNKWCKILDLIENKINYKEIMEELVSIRKTMNNGGRKPLPLNQDLQLCLLLPIVIRILMRSMKMMLRMKIEKHYKR